MPIIYFLNACILTFVLGEGDYNNICVSLQLEHTIFIQHLFLTDKFSGRIL